MKLNIYLTQHAQSHVDGGQQGSKRRSHIRVKCWSREAEHKQGSVFCQIHTLTRKQTHTNQNLTLFLSLHGYQQLLPGVKTNSIKSPDHFWKQGILSQNNQGDLVKKNLAAVWSEVLQGCQGFAEDFQKTALHSQQGFLLGFLSLPSTCRLFRRGLRGPLCPRKGSRGQRLTIFGLKEITKQNIKPLYEGKNKHLFLVSAKFSCHYEII